MTKAKRKRQSEIGHDARLTDPYLLKSPPCRFGDHHRKQRGNNAIIQSNCADNPNCLYGLGEHQTGVWQGGKLIRRLFGDDPRERQREVVDSELKPAGLRNLGATCYLNSMLQCLFVNLPFREAVYEWEPKEELVNNRDQALQMRALQKLFAQMQLGNESYYDPTEFASTLALNNVMQQDAQEFSKLLLAHLRTIFQQSRIPSHWNLIDRIFQGQMSYVTKCLNCTHKSMRSSSYYEISLNLKGHKSVDDCIGSYLATEVLEDENKYFCEQCNAKQCAERFLQLDPHALPPTLMVQLMRFVYDASSGRKKKVTDEIEIPQTLNMTALLRQSGHAKAFNESEDAIYRLQGYLNHRGKSAHVGHYTASVAYPQSNSESGVEWFEFDDAMVSKKDDKDEETIRSRDIYMLLYVRVLPDDPLSVRNGNPTPIPLPSKTCRDEVEALNVAFQAKVQDYASKVHGIETRIQERIDAYRTYFETSQPYPDPSARQYYWVDTDWLRCWVTGEEHVKTSSSYRAEEASKAPLLSTGDVPTPQETQTDDDSDDCVIIDAPEDKLASEKEPTRSSDEILESGEASESRLPSPSDAVTVRNEEISFMKPVNVVRFCCEHSSAALDQAPVLRFGPATAPKLKRISAQLFAYLRENCTRKARIEVPSHDRMNAFEAPSYRCPDCEKAFHLKLLTDVERLQQVENELELLNGSPAGLAAVVATGNAFFMSRQWIKTYKNRLEKVRKELLQAALKAKRKRKAVAGPECSKPVPSGQDTDQEELELLNKDITCCHGHLTLKKRLYRPVLASTWAYFRAKFPFHAEFREADTKPCEQCQSDDLASKKGMQEKRDGRKEILSVAAFETLYHRQPREGRIRLLELFESPAAQRGIGLEEASSWTKRDDRTTLFRRLFLVSRAWLAQWREYIDNVDIPSLLAFPGTMSFVCTHGQLVLPPSLMAATEGELLDASALDVELVSLDEMQALARHYGEPDMSFYYGLVVRTGERVHVAWRHCSFLSLQPSHEDASVPLTSDEAKEKDVICAACQAICRREHREALENFEQRVVQIQQLKDTQGMPTSSQSAACGPRRSRRTRVRSVLTWPIVANARDSVYLLKTKLYAETDVVPIRQCLYFEGKSLNDCRTLKECGIKAGDVVFLRVLEDDGDELVMMEESLQREVGFADSVFHSQSLTKRQEEMIPIESGSEEEEVAKPTANNREARVWVCQSCTFVNDNTDPVCEICLMRKVT